MRITNIQVQLANRGEKPQIKAYVSFTVEDSLAIHDVKIIDGKDGPFVAMPSRKEPGGRYLDIVHPATKEARQEITDAIMGAYLEHMEKPTK